MLSDIRFIMTYVQLREIPLHLNSLDRFSELVENNANSFLTLLYEIILQAVH